MPRLYNAITLQNGYGANYERYTTEQTKTFPDQNAIYLGQWVRQFTTIKLKHTGLPFEVFLPLLSSEMVPGRTLGEGGQTCPECSDAIATFCSLSCFTVPIVLYTNEYGGRNNTNCCIHRRQCLISFLI